MTPYEFASRSHMDALPSFTLNDSEKKANESLKNKKDEWKSYEIHELNAGKFKWRVIETTKGFEGDYWDFKTLGEAENWCRDFSPNYSQDIRGSKYALYKINDPVDRGVMIIDNPYYVCKHESTYTDQHYQSNSWYLMCGMCDKPVSNVGHISQKAAELEESAHHGKTGGRPDECKGPEGCPENQTCGYCGGDDTPCSCGHQDVCRKDCGNRMELWAPEPDAEGPTCQKSYLCVTEGCTGCADGSGEPDVEASTPTLDLYLLMCYDIDGSLVVLDGCTDKDIIFDRYEPDGDEWIVKMNLPLQKMIDSEPKNPPIVEIEIN